MTEQLRRPETWLLSAIIVVYSVLGVLYAVYTPPWQAPDEPAHYNYVRYLAEERRLPVMQPGDYPPAYLEEIKAAKFPPEMSIEPLRFAFWHPPLYYLLLVPLYLLFRGALIPLRLFSVACGAGLLIVAYGLVRRLFPRLESLALGAVSLVAFVPQHLAMNAAVNNDALADLLLAGVMWGLVNWVMEGTQEDRVNPGERRRLVLISVLMGLGLLTKASTLISLPLALIALILRRKWSDARAVVSLLLPALLLALPWMVRNVTVYGGLDVFGWGRHAAVVTGQPRTAEWIALYGPGNVLRWGLITTFQSFWAQFGWMAVPIDQRIYLALALFCGLVGVGFVLYLRRVWRERDLLEDKGRQRAAGLLVIWLLLPGASWLWYNVTFVQHQGRYWFPALIPIALFFTLGWWESLRVENARRLAVVLLIGCVAAIVGGLLSGRLSKTLVALTGGMAALLAGQSFLDTRFRLAAFALPYLGLVALAFICPFAFIVPYL